MAERVEQRLHDLERLVLKQAERIEELEEQFSALTRLAHQTILHIPLPNREAA